MTRKLKCGITPAKARRYAAMVAAHLQNLECRDVHHPKRHRHLGGEECPAVIELLDAALRLCEFVNEVTEAKT